MAPPCDVAITCTTRIQAKSPSQTPCIVPLSLLDATTAEFALTSAVWLFDRPRLASQEPFDLTTHLASTLSTTLDAYPQWAGQIEAVQTVDGQGPAEATDIPVHARRFGRLFAKFGHKRDPGVAFSAATCAITLDELYPAERRVHHTFWDSQAWLNRFTSQADIADAFQPDVEDTNGLLKPVMAIQVTTLACGGFALAAKIAHPLADITALVTFMNDWATISRTSILQLERCRLCPVFNPCKVDAAAARNIDAPEPAAEVLQRSATMPMHRYDWWRDVSGCPWPTNIPEPFRKAKMEAAGTAMPWSEWETGSPVSCYIVRLSAEQVEFLWASANKESGQRLSRHDAVLAHIWSSINRARRLGTDTGPVHCDLTCGVRPVLQLGGSFIGSPIVIINIQALGAEVAGEAASLGSVATRVRGTIGQVLKPEPIGDHLHSLAYEKSPQRIWQAFLGRRHILVTTWARAGVYNIDFGFASEIRYVDGIVPDMDGIVVIKEAPPIVAAEAPDTSWTRSGVDVSIRIRAEDMERLLADPLLFPSFPLLC
ncbi:transferase family [Cordyceps militaris]|uniref:Transferase family n=1 Tax=Cordyceps militaris TaxID=73501 RepID=A0A2H4SB21_CORMI|nr:transferase family [Cordyceps militaris]